MSYPKSLGDIVRRRYFVPVPPPPPRVQLSQHAVRRAAVRLSCALDGYKFLTVYGVPGAGAAAALALSCVTGLRAVDTARDADVLIDTVERTGATLRRWSDAYPGKPFVTLFSAFDYGGAWLVMPWDADPIQPEHMPV